MPKGGHSNFHLFNKAPTSRFGSATRHHVPRRLTAGSIRLHTAGVRSFMTSLTGDIGAAVMAENAARPPPTTAADAAAATPLTPACVRCRSFKKKCSRTFPSCALCTAAGQSCSYAPPFDPRLRNRQLQARIEWLTAYINRNPPIGGFTGGKRTIDQVETGADLEDAVWDSSRDLDLQSPQAVTSPTWFLRDTTITQAHNLRRQNTHTRLPGQINTASPTSSSASTSLHAHSETPDATGSSVASNNAHNETTSSARPGSATATTARSLVDGFFSHVGRSYPCVDRGAVYATLDKTTEPFEAVALPPDLERSVLQLVMAIGADSLHRAGHLPPSVAKSFHIDYAALLHNCLLRPSLTTVQILVLLVIHSFTDSNYPGTWTLASIASRQAIDLGLTMRRHTHEMERDEESERRHRIFWSVFVIDSRMSMGLGVQPTIRTETVNIPYPRLTVGEFTSSERGQIASGLQITQQAIEISRLEAKIFTRIHLESRRVPLSVLSSEIRRDTTEGIRLEIENWYSKWCLLPISEATDAITVQSSVSWMSNRYYHLLTLLHYSTHFNLCEADAGVTAKLVALLDSAARYVRSVVILLQQRQLSLNRLTLCRLLPAGMMLVYGLLHIPAYPARESVIALVEILDAYEQGLEYAHAAASILRQFQASSRHHHPVRQGLHSHPATWHQAQSIEEDAGSLEVRNACFTDMLKLLQRFLGPTSSFCWGLAEQAQLPDNQGGRSGTAIGWPEKMGAGGAYLATDTVDSSVDELGMLPQGDFGNGFGDF